MRARVITALLLVASVALATPKQDLDQANDRFRKGQFGDALLIYNKLLYPTPQLASADDLADAYVGLGVCRLETGDSDGARREFEKALQIDPNKQLDPLLITNRSAIRLFDDTKADLRTREAREADKKRAAEFLEAKRAWLASAQVFKSQNYWLNFAPVGIGQFQNEEPAKGFFFLGAQIATATTSAAIWGYLVNKYGIRSDKVPLDDGASVRRLQQIQIGAGIAFWGLYAWSVVDAHLHYTPNRRVEVDETLLPPELRDFKTKPPPKPKKTSFRIIPMISPDGAGIGIGWENM